MLFDLRFILGYTFAAMVVMLAACNQVLAGQASASDRPPTYYYAPSRPGTLPTYANRSNMPTDLRFILQYTFPTVVVVWSLPTEFWLARLATYGRPPAHYYAPGRLVTLPCMPKSFKYVHRPLIHVQICLCCCGYCACCHQAGQTVFSVVFVVRILPYSRVRDITAI
jgi:hypothetical protein